MPTAEVCWFGTNCTNDQCPRAHPQGKTVRSEIICKFDRKCTNAQCPFKHPNGKLSLQPAHAAANVVCRFGRACTNDACVFLHPQGKAAKPPRPHATNGAGPSAPKGPRGANVVVAGKPRAAEAGPSELICTPAIVTQVTPRGLTLSTKAPAHDFRVSWTEAQIPPAARAQYTGGTVTTVHVHKSKADVRLVLFAPLGGKRKACVCHNAASDYDLFHKVEETCTPVQCHFRRKFDTLKQYTDHFTRALQLEVAVNAVQARWSHLVTDTDLDLKALECTLQAADYPRPSFFISAGDLVCIRHEAPPYWVRHTTVAQHPAFAPDKKTLRLRVAPIAATPSGGGVCRVVVEVVPVPVSQRNTLSALRRLEDMCRPVEAFLLATPPKAQAKAGAGAGANGAAGPGSAGPHGPPVPPRGMGPAGAADGPGAAGSAAPPDARRNAMVILQPPVCDVLLGFLGDAERRIWGQVCRACRAMEVAAACADFGFLNGAQKEAVVHGLRVPCSMIQGPPGTGKTVTGTALAAAFALGGGRDRKGTGEGRGEGGVGGTGGGEGTGSSEGRGKVMYCGPSNQSVDNAAEQFLVLQKRGLLPPDLRILRVYAPSVEQQDIALCYPNVAEQCRYSADGEEEAAEGQETPADESPRRHAVPAWIHKVALHHQVDPYDVLRRSKALAAQQQETVEAADVILTTCATACDRRVSPSACDVHCLIIDEAAQATEPEAVVAVERFAAAEAPAGARPGPGGWDGVRRLVLLGDHRQLGPVALTSPAVLGVSLFERLAARGRPLLLRVQYRMHPLIRGFPSLHFYGGRLEDGYSARGAAPLQCLVSAGAGLPYAGASSAAEAAAGASGTGVPDARVEGALPETQGSVQATPSPPEGTDASTARAGGAGAAAVGGMAGGGVAAAPGLRATPTVFCHVAGREERGTACEASGVTSVLNRPEAAHVVAIAGQLAQRCAAASIAVITPYTAQVALIGALMAEAGLEGVSVGTIASMQGSERDYVICSWVRSRGPAAAPADGADAEAARARVLGFLANPKHVNVALTRARHALVCVGDADTLRHSATFDAVLQYYAQRQWLVAAAQWPGEGGFCDPRSLERSR